MAYFNLGKKLQLLLIAGALATSSCYQSSSRGLDASDGPRPDREDAAVDAADGRRDAQPEVEMVDPPPPPLPACGVVTTRTIAVSTAESSRSYAVGEARVSGIEVAWCSTADPCVETTLYGAGTITDVTQTDMNAIRFRYTNAGLQTWEVLSFALAWHVDCKVDGRTEMRTLNATGYICRDETSGLIKISGDMNDCPMVVDCLPSPMAAAAGAGRYRIAGSPAEGGAVALTLDGLSGGEEVRWSASGGRLETASPGRALFFPPDGGGVQAVQAAVVTNGGVVVEVYRHAKS